MNYTITKEPTGKVLVESTTLPPNYLPSDALVKQTSSGVDILNSNFEKIRTFDAATVTQVDDGKDQTAPTTPTELFDALKSVFIDASDDGASYYLARPLSDQVITGVAPLTPLEISEGVNIFGDNIVNNGGGLYTLLKNNTYKLSCELAVGGGGGEYSEAFSFYDITNSSYIGVSGLVRDFEGDSTQHSSNPIAIITPSTDTQVMLCFVSRGDKDLIVLKVDSSLLIEQIR